MASRVLPTIFSREQLDFIAAHWQIDMSPFQLAVYFNCDQYEIFIARKKLGLKSVFKHLNTFHTPYPSQIAKEVKKFSWSSQPQRLSENVEEKIYQANP